jgi:hypothetical protein
MSLVGCGCRTNGWRYSSAEKCRMWVECILKACRRRRARKHTQCHGSTVGELLSSTILNMNDGPFYPVLVVALRGRNSKNLRVINDSFRVQRSVERGWLSICRRVSLRARAQGFTVENLVSISI